MYTLLYYIAAVVGFLIQAWFVVLGVLVVGQFILQLDLHGTSFKLETECQRPTILTRARCFRWLIVQMSLIVISLCATQSMAALVRYDVRQLVQREASRAIVLLNGTTTESPSLKHALQRLRFRFPHHSHPLDERQFTVEVTDGRELCTLRIAPDSMNPGEYWVFTSMDMEYREIGRIALATYPQVAQTSTP